ncbi:unnamed protein product [Agarophyton chilense]
MAERPLSSVRAHASRSDLPPLRHTRPSRMANVPQLLTVTGIVLIFMALCVDVSMVHPRLRAAALAAPLSRTDLPPNLPHPYTPNSLAMSNPTRNTRRSSAAGSSHQPKAPSKKEIGNAGWTLIHAIAANFPKDPSEKEKHHARAFLRSMTKLYPCKRCRLHFSKYLASTPPSLSSREAFMMWACGAHNAVNQRQGKQVFPCDMKTLEDRWGDCGCSVKSTE